MPASDEAVARRSAVAVLTDFDGPVATQSGRDRQVAGTGVLVEHSGVTYVLTCSHVLAGRSEARVVCVEGELHEERTARTVADAPLLDIALLSIDEALPEGAVPAAMATTHQGTRRWLAYGHPDRQLLGTNASGRSQPSRRGAVTLETERDAEPIVQGFSGAGVHDAENGELYSVIISHSPAKAISLLTIRTTFAEHLGDAPPWAPLEPAPGTAPSHPPATPEPSRAEPFAPDGVTASADQPFDAAESAPAPARRRPMGSRSEQLSVFISYGHDEIDTEIQRRLVQMLKPVARHFDAEVWSDTALRAGDRWHDEIGAAIDRADIALLLPSPKFLASDYIQDIEVPRIVERRIPYSWMLVRDCGWQHEPTLSRVQSVNTPPIAVGGLSGAAIDTPISECADWVRAELSRVRDAQAGGLFAPTGEADSDDDSGRGASPLGRAHRPADRPTSPPIGRETPAEAADDESSSGHGVEGGLDVTVPALVDRLVERPTVMAEIKATLFGEVAGAVAVAGRSMGLRGTGGIGKSVLAAMVARDPEVRRAFPDGVAWVTLGESPNLLEQQRGLLARLGADTDDVTNPVTAATALRATLEHRQLLLVVDDVWSDAAVEAFDVVGERGRVLITTRAHTELIARDQVIEIDRLDDAAAVAFLARAADTTVEDIEADDTRSAAARRIVVSADGTPLGLSMIGAVLRSDGDWPAAAERLAGIEHGLDGHPYENAFRSMRFALDALAATGGEQRVERYRELAVYPEDVAVPTEEIAHYWAHTGGLDAEQVEAVLSELARRRLLTRAASGDVTFHDLQRAFLLYETEHLALRHHSLLEAHTSRLPLADRGGHDRASWPRWSSLPADDWLWSHLAHHLTGAGRIAELIHTVRDPAWTLQRAVAADPVQSESECDAAAMAADAAGLDPDGDLREVSKSLRQMATIIRQARDARPSQALTTAARAVHLRLGRTADMGLSRGLDLGLLSELADVPEPSATGPALGGFPRALERIITGHTGSVWSVAWSPDGTRLATASGDKTARIWDTGGNQLATLTGHTNRVWSVAWSPDGTRLATASDDKTARIWDTSGNQLATLTGHTNSVRSVAWSPDGTRLATASRDDTARIWDTHSNQLDLLCLGGAVRSVGWADRRDGRPGRHLAVAVDSWWTVITFDADHHSPS